jgi:hypothetical protein
VQKIIILQYYSHTLLIPKIHRFWQPEPLREFGKYPASSAQHSSWLLITAEGRVHHHSAGGSFIMIFFRFIYNLHNAAQKEKHSIQSSFSIAATDTSETPWLQLTDNRVTQEEGIKHCTQIVPRKNQFIW